jgi:hypothetical protein
MLQAKVQEQADTATVVVSTDVERSVPWPIRPRPARAFFWGLSGCSITWKHAFWNRKVGDNAWAYNEHRLLHLLGRYSCYVKLHSAAALMAPSPNVAARDVVGTALSSRPWCRYGDNAHPLT